MIFEVNFLKLILSFARDGCRAYIYIYIYILDQIVSPSKIMAILSRI